MARVSDGEKLCLCHICFNNCTKGVVTRRTNPTTDAQRHLLEGHDYDFTGSYCSKKAIPVKLKGVLYNLQTQYDAQHTSFDRRAYEGLLTTWAITTSQPLRQAVSQ